MLGTNSRVSKCQRCETYWVMGSCKPTCSTAHWDLSGEIVFIYVCMFEGENKNQTGDAFAMLMDNPHKDVVVERDRGHLNQGDCSKYF